MSKFNTFSAAICMALTASFASAEDATLDQFRALTVIAVADNPLTATLIPVEVVDEASAARGVLRKGDKISFEISGVEGAMVYILNMDTSGTIRMIYPNEFQSTDTPQEMAELMLPGDSAKYEFQISGDAGTEVIKVIAVDGDASILEALLDSLFDKKQAFPRAIYPAEKTTDELSSFFGENASGNIRETTLEYVISK